MEVEEDTPSLELVGLAPELGLVEEGALEVELRKGDRGNDEVGGVQGVEDYVVVGRGRIDEEEVVRAIRGRKDAPESVVADGPELDEVQRRGEEVDPRIDRGKGVLSQALGVEKGGHVLAVSLVRRVEVVGRSAVLDVEVGDENAVACGGGIVGDEDAEGGLAGAALDRGETDNSHETSDYYSNPKNTRTSAMSFLIPGLAGSTEGSR